MARSAPVGRGRIERLLGQEGLRLAGVDEVGRGCLAGPIFAASAVLNSVRLKKLPRARRELLRDSKQLSSMQRAAMVPVIRDLCDDWQVASASAREIDLIGISPANFLAMRRALALCGEPFDMLLVDGKWPVKGYDRPQRAVIKGDNLCFAIAAASILAKEARDDFMREQALFHPQYGFEAHVGYGTAHHLAMIARHGICQLHRQSFEPIKGYVQGSATSGTAPL